MASRTALAKVQVRHGPQLGSGFNRISCRRTAGHWQTAARCSSTVSSASSITDVGAPTHAPHTSPPRRQHRFRRFPKYLRDSPNSTLALRLKSRTAPLTFGAWKRFDSIAKSCSLRLPVVMLQKMIRQEEALLPTSLSDSLCDPAQWRTRLNSLAFKGIGEADIEHWIWIMSAKDADERIERFVSVDRPKPVFLLFQLLRRDETFHKGRSLTSLYTYISRHHVQSRSASPDAALPFGAVRRTLDPGLNMAPQTFATLLRLLVHHYVRLWPSALPPVARLVCDYVETIQHMSKNAQQAYKDSCMIFNHALALFQRKSPTNPILQMRYNWRAQKVLLAMSTNMPRPLLINRDGFRAIRRVMLALRKSPAERKVALQMARTWPPYRRNWDGLDEKRLPEDDFSRSVRAGVLMREAGYAEMEHDRALGVLGGAVPGDGPTVQTRSLAPRTWTGEQANMNVYSTWAARVRATRDVNEAWHEFQAAPTEKMRPSVQVYAEMFKKLLADSVDPSRLSAYSAPNREVLPGDTREVFPVNDAALTAFEKQRLRPPSVATLYAQMLQEGGRPIGDCLSVLVENAPSVEAALRYLHDSPIDNTAVAALKLPHATPLRSSPFSSSPNRRAFSYPPPLTLDLLRKIPLANLNAYISLICRFQPRLAAEPARFGRQRRAGLIHHAVNICARRLPPILDEGRTYKAPWHTILRTLAKPRLMLSAQHTQDGPFHDAEALALALRVFAQVKRAGGADVVMFHSLNRTAQKCLQWADPTAAAAVSADAKSSAESSQADDSSSSAAQAEEQASAAPKTDTATLRTHALLKTAHATLLAAFREMTGVSAADENGAHTSEAVTATTAPGHPATRHNITAGTLETYLRTLGHLGDTASMASTVRWILRMWDDDAVLEDAKDPDGRQHAALGRALVVFRAFAETQVEDGVLADLEQQLRRLQETRGCTWRWPTSDEADEYVRWHRQPHTSAFWARVRPSA